MSNIQTNFRAVDMPGASKAEPVKEPAPKKEAPVKKTPAAKKPVGKKAVAEPQVTESSDTTDNAIADAPEATDSPVSAESSEGATNE